MSNQTLRKPPARRAVDAAKSSGKARYRKQTARGGTEFRRDGTPLISLGKFGWGRHLTRLEKQRVQTRAAYGAFGLIVVAVIGVFIFGVLQQNILIPNYALVRVNGTKITQDSYRKYLDYEAQVLWNQLQSEIKQEQAAAAAAQNGDQNASTEDQILISQIQVDEGDYQQATITSNMAQQLVEDQLIQQGITQFEASHVKAATFAVTNATILTQLNAFKKSFPAGQTYQGFLSKDHLSESDVRAAIAVDLRRDVMQKYLSSLIVSPTTQVHLRRIQLDTAAHAAKVRAELVKDPSDANWAKLAKSDSEDATTKNVGGDMGWIFRGGNDSGIENWAFGPGIKVNEISPVIKDATSTYDVLQVLGFDAHRTIDASTLSAAQNNALDHWLAGAKVDPKTNISPTNQAMLTDSRNLPVQPDLNATLPNYNPNANGGGTGTTP